MSNRLRNLSNRAVLFILITVALASSVASFIVNLTNEVDTIPAWWVGWLQNFSTEMFGAFLTFILLTLIVGTRQEKERLLRQIRSRVNGEAIRALEELREQGWLHDGSLRGASFWTAKLPKTSLSEVDLEGADLGSTNLQQANMQSSNLRKVDLIDANLQGANLSGTDLQGAFLIRADLRGANMKFANLHRSDLLEATFDEETILPDGSKWTSETDLARFTDVAHPQFWRPEPNIGKSLSWYEPNKLIK